MKLSNELARDAKKQGICEDWYLALKNETDIDSLLEMYVRGIDFCLSNDYPSNDYIRKNFKGKMEAHGIHLDEKLSIVNELKVIALGKCSGTVEVNDFDVCEIFIKHESELTVTAKGNSFVMIDLFDNARLSLKANENAKVCVNNYGGEIVYSQHDNSQVKIIEKNKKTY